MNSRLLVPALLVPCILGTPLRAVDRLYWSTNTTSDTQQTNSMWSLGGKNWSTNKEGTGELVAWKPGSVAVFPFLEKQLILAEGPLEVGGIEAEAVEVAGELRKYGNLLIKKGVTPC